MILEIIAGVVSVGIITFISIAYIRTRRMNVQLLSKMVQLEIDKNVIENNMRQALMDIESVKMQESDGFVKFVSESRDWAFKYIDDVQKSINVVKHDWENGNQLEESMSKLFDYLPAQTNEEK